MMAAADKIVASQCDNLDFLALKVPEAWFNSCNRLQLEHRSVAIAPSMHATDLEDAFLQD